MLLVQLPPSQPRDDIRLAYFLHLIPDWIRVTVEFRHYSWHCERLFQQRRKRERSAERADPPGAAPTRRLPGGPLAAWLMARLVSSGAAGRSCPSCWTALYSAVVPASHTDTVTSPVMTIGSGRREDAQGGAERGDDRAADRDREE